MATNGPSKEAFEAVRPAGFTFIGFALLNILILLGGCEMGPSMFLGARDREIGDSTQALKSARNDEERAKAYSARGAAYSEKARYSRAFKLIPADEYGRLFDLAVRDHNEAIRLNPDGAEMYFNRAQAYYDRGSLDLREQKDAKPWFDLAAADFEKTTEKAPKNDVAFDRLGLTHEENGESDKAILAYTKELALNPWAKQRLADAYCNRGFRLQQQKNDAAAAVEYWKSIEFGVADDHVCPYDPFGSLVGIYTVELHDYDKAWDLVHRAQKSGQRIQSELLDKLKKDSGRAD